MPIPEPPYSPLPLRFKPGIQRDGTRLAAPGNWIDGKWVRFSRGLPRKMAGFKQLSDNVNGIQRAFEINMHSGRHHIHMGSNSSLSQISVTDAGVPGSPEIRTPGTLTMTGSELWQMGTVFDAITNNSATLIAHPGLNLNDISNTAVSPIYGGVCDSTDVLTELTGLTDVNGGVCVVQPYVTIFGSEGYFGWSGPNKPNDQTVINGGGAANITAQKIVAGRSVQGGSGPSGLYWSLDSLIRTSFIGGTATWAFTTVSDGISIMSSRAIASFGDGAFYWMGQNKFFVYDGSVREIPNPYNSDFVFDNINWSHRQKCFAFANQRWGEVWFCFPYGSATECTHAAVYNLEGYWYDTILPGSGRGGALSGNVYRYPVMSGVNLVSGSNYRLWQHETGVDEVIGSSVYPVNSFVESSDITMLTGQKPQNKNISCVGVEPDFVQSGDMTLTITGNANSRSSEVESEVITFAPPPVAVVNQILRPKVERRQMRFKWESNTLGGTFQMGVPIAHVGMGSGRETG